METPADNITTTNGAQSATEVVMVSDHTRQQLATIGGRLMRDSGVHTEIASAARSLPSFGLDLVKATGGVRIHNTLRLGAGFEALKAQRLGVWRKMDMDRLLGVDLFRQRWSPMFDTTGWTDMIGRSVTDAMRPQISRVFDDGRPQLFSSLIGAHRANFALAAWRPQATALSRLSDELEPVIGSIVRSASPRTFSSLDLRPTTPTAVAGLVSEPADLEAVVESLADRISPSDATPVRDRLSRVSDVGNLVAAAVATLTFLLVASGDPRVQRWAGQLLERLDELSRSLCS